MLHGESDREVLLASFLNFVPEKEAAIIRRLACGEFVNLQAITDVLSEHRIFAQPNANNIYDLCCSAAKTTLILLPNFSFQMIRKGMGHFWMGVSKSMFLSIYDCLVPNAEKVITSLDLREVQMQDQKITIRLHRYLRSSDETTIIFFVRFVTGCSSVTGAESERICEFRKFQCGKMSATMVDRRRKFLILDELKQS